jgi:hypothetical protein
MKGAMDGSIGMLKASVGLGVCGGCVIAIVNLVFLIMVRTQHIRMAF